MSPLLILAAAAALFQAGPVLSKLGVPDSALKIFKLYRGVVVLLAILALAIILQVSFLILWPIVRPFDKDVTFLHHFTVAGCNIMGRLLCLPIEMVGTENLPKKGCDPYVLVANHQSDLDVFIFGRFLGLVFKVTFKWELIYVPGLGTSMFMAGYLPVKRGNRASGSSMLSVAIRTVERGIPMMFFAEGTRKIDGSLGPLGAFKPGAFIVATRTGAPILPVTISGARAVMPMSGLPMLGWNEKVLLTVHPMVPSKDKTVDDLSAEIRKVIGSALRPCDEVKIKPGKAPAPAVENKKAQ